MPRLPRVNIEGSLYYITSRGGSNKPLFYDNQDFEIYRELLSRYKDQFKFKLFAYVLMASHIHLLIELTGSATISEIMHSINSLYTQLKKQINSHEYLNNRTRVNSSCETKALSACSLALFFITLEYLNQHLYYS